MCCGWLLDCSGWLLGILSHFQLVIVRVLSLRSSVIHGFVTEPWYSRHVLFSFERVCSSVHMAGDLFAGHVLVFCFVWARGFCPSFLCAMCSHVICLDPTHLVTCLLFHFPQLLSLVTLPICSFIISLCLQFAVRFGFSVTPSWSSQVAGQVKCLVSFLFCFLVFTHHGSLVFQPCWLLFRLVFANFLLIFTFAFKDFLKSPLLFCVWVLSAKIPDSDW